MKAPKQDKASASRRGALEQILPITVPCQADTASLPYLAGTGSRWPGEELALGRTALQGRQALQELEAGNCAGKAPKRALLKQIHLARGVFT